MGKIDLKPIVITIVAAAVIVGILCGIVLGMRGC